MNFKRTEALVADGPVFATSNLSYSELAQRLLVADAERRKLESEIRDGVADLCLRRVQMIRAGQECPGSDGLTGLPGWQGQRRREELAYSYRAADEANRKAGLLNRS